MASLISSPKKKQKTFLNLFEFFCKYRLIKLTRILGHRRQHRQHLNHMTIMELVQMMNKTRDGTTQNKFNQTNPTCKSYTVVSVYLFFANFFEKIFFGTFLKKIFFANFFLKKYFLAHFLPKSVESQLVSISIGQGRFVHLVQQKCPKHIILYNSTHAAIC